MHVSGGVPLSLSATGRGESSLYFLWTERRVDVQGAESASPANAPDLTEEIAVVVPDSAPSQLIGQSADRQPIRNTPASGKFFQNKRRGFYVIGICLISTRDKKKSMAKNSISKA